jgi:type VI secretion system protein ImpJ
MKAPVEAKHIPEAIQWHEGMLLTPEHFLQMTTRQEMLVGYGLACAPYLWGVRRFAWDANLLAAGLLSVTELEAVLPDGLVVNALVPGDLKLDLHPCAEQMKQGPVSVCLAVPIRKPVSAEGDLERYESVPAAPGEITGNSVDGIPRLRPRLTLVPAPLPPKYVGFPLLQIRLQNEVFTASADYPVLSVPVSSDIGKLCSHVARHVREKAIYLADRIRGPESASGTQSELHMGFLIHSLVAALPAFEGALYAGETHPFALYLALCSLAGCVAPVGLSMVPPIFPAYDHNSPYHSFEEVKAYIFQVIAEGISETWTTFRFRREAEAYVLAANTGWSDLLPPEPTPARPPLVLALRTPSGASEKDMVTWGTNCVIGTAAVIPSLVTRRILGAPRRAIEALPDLVPEKGLLLFELDLNPEFIRRGEDLQIFDRRPDAVSPADILLFVRKPGK